jgi:hypothetical protein
MLPLPRLALGRWNYMRVNFPPYTPMCDSTQARSPQYCMMLAPRSCTQCACVRVRVRLDLSCTHVPTLFSLSLHDLRIGASAILCCGTEWRRRLPGVARMRLLPHIYTPNGAPSHAHTAHAAAACSHTPPHGSGGTARLLIKLVRARTGAPMVYRGGVDPISVIPGHTSDCAMRCGWCVQAKNYDAELKRSDAWTFYLRFQALRLVPSHSLAHSRCHSALPPPNATRSLPTVSSNRSVVSSRRGLYASPCMWAARRGATGGVRVYVWLACYWTVLWRQVKNPMLTAAMAFHADGGTISRPTHRRAPCYAALFCGEGRYMAAIAGLSRRSWLGPNC